MTAREELEAALRDAHTLTVNLGDQRMNWRPAAGVWSVAECLDHLTITCRRMMKAMDAGVDQLRAQNQRFAGPVRPGWIGRWFLWVLEPPVKKSHFKAPAAFVPQPDRPAHLVRSEFFTAHEELLHRWADYEAWDQNRRVVISPFNSHARYSVGLALRIVPAHARRHLWQAREVLKQAPASFGAAN